MTRLSLLLPMILVLSFDPAYARVTTGWGGVAIFLGVLAALVAGGRLLSVRLADRVADESLAAAVGRVTWLLGWARTTALLWTGAGLYLLGWAWVVPRLLGPLHLSWADLAGTVLLTLPSYLTWIALYWAQYPAERATREQAILMHLDANLPVRAPPTLWQYMEHQLRTGPGLILMPVLAVLLTRDVIFLSLRSAGVHAAAAWQGVIYLGSTALVYVLAPLILVRVLRTRRLERGPLRARLEAIARQSGVAVRDIRVWHTGNTAANALVSGVVPGLRYVLLSDLLIESMPDEQIEAVFAHELGHIVHWHMAWYGAYLMSVSLILGWLAPAQAWLERTLGVGLGGEATNTPLSLGLILLGFGLLSRRFERQADVYAARAIEAVAPSPPPPTLPPAEPSATNTGPEASTRSESARPDPRKTPVRPRGAGVFAASLARVAWINNMPASAPNFTHGSIQSRIDALQEMALSPEATAGFDRWMVGVRLVLVALVIGAGVTAGIIGVQ